MLIWAGSISRPLSICVEHNYTSVKQLEQFPVAHIIRNNINSKISLVMRIILDSYIYKVAISCGRHRDIVVIPQRDQDTLQTPGITIREKILRIL